VRGLGPIDNPIHVLGHSLSAFYDLPHGAAMSITILAYMKTDIEARKARFARFARNVMGVTETDDLKAAKMGIDLLEAWFKKIGTPTNFKEAGMPENELDELAADALKTANAWGLGELWTKERALNMFKVAL
jgi:alcohol dehydrogenase YqhD (iron-dependent ADH family)